MIKYFFKILCFIMLICFANSAFAIYGNYDEFIPEEIETPQNTKVLAKGSIFRGFLSQTVSSEYNNSGDIIKVLITSDLILNDEVILPKNSLFIGQIKILEKAQRGRDGFFSIDIIQLILPDGNFFPAKGYISAPKKGKIFGGNFTKRASHKNTVHRATPVGRKGVLYLQQNGPRIMGEETKIKMGELVTIILEEQINLEQK